MSLLSLIYRTAGAWGAGKGSNLTAAEFDENNYDIQQAVNDLINNPVLPAEVEDVTIANGNQLSFTMSDARVLGPVTIPLAAIVFRGEHAPTTEYHAAELFTATDPATNVRGLYFVNRDFESGLAFDPDLGIGIGGSSPYASFVMAVYDRVRVGWFWPGKPGEGIPTDALASSDEAIMFSFLTTDEFYLLEDFPASIAKLRGPPAADMDFGIAKNNVRFGTLAFVAGDADGTFSFDDSAGSIQFEVGDSLELTVPTEGVDATAYALAVTIVGRLGTLDAGSSS